MDDLVKVAIGAALVGVAGLIGYEVYKAKAATPMSATPTGFLTAGHRYVIAIPNGASAAAGNTASTYQTALDASVPGQVKVVSVGVTGMTANVTLDVISATVPTSLFPGATFTDLGTSPAGG
jgi:hypothetical protein